MLNINTLFVSIAAVTIGGGGSIVHADKIKCAPVAKKLEWHLCVRDAVPYKRGMKTETRDECKIDKVVKPAGGCDFGDVAKFIPEGADLDKVTFYAIGPIDFDTRPWEHQGEPNYGQCAISSKQELEGWETMKFSEAFDKSNSARSDMVKDKLKAKKKALFPFGLSVIPGPQGCAEKSAKMGVIDKKSLSQFLVYGEYKFKE